ncbi:hypothetical protein [Methylobacterium nonmethylotrophicum]|uniref:Uncharacterized protein n=1 Tax=Methylobacterium nonmethylotrophicum TaxID=1141884 RepID=A0A4Z0NQ05_9HYPH|nr:hypothetical protein [Methylobacterium nonmethylotrophicum]TGD99012.1 hypothetical protein EU555_13995 [Methylobacterium nonmethylotrophicum]
MAKTDQARPSLRDFDPYTDRNGQDMGQDSPLDLGVPQRTQRDMDHDPMGEARDARIASDFYRRDAIGAIDGSQATADETPPENLRRISDPSTGSPATSEAIDRATASLGKDEEG